MSRMHVESIFDGVPGNCIRSMCCIYLCLCSWVLAGVAEQLAFSTRLVRVGLNASEGVSQRREYGRRAEGLCKEPVDEPGG